MLDVRLEEVSPDSHLLRGAAIAWNFGVNDLLFVRYLFGLGHGSNSDLTSAIDHRFQFACHSRRYGPCSRVRLGVHGGPHNRVGIICRAVPGPDRADADYSDGAKFHRAIVYGGKAIRRER